MSISLGRYALAAAVAALLCTANGNANATTFKLKIGAGHPPAGLWIAALTRPSWTNSGRFWAWAVAAATMAAAKAQVPSRWVSLMARISSASIGIDIAAIVASGARKVTWARGPLGGSG